MSLPASKGEFLTRFHKAADGLLAELAAVSDERWHEPVLEDGRSPADLLAYQLGWGRLLLTWEAEEMAGRQPVMPAPGFKWNQLGALAQHFYQAAAGTSRPALVAQFASLRQSLEAWLQGMDETLLLEPGQRRWAGDKWPLAKWIQVNTVAPYNAARTKLRRWAKTAAARD